MVVTSEGRVGLTSIINDLRKFPLLLCSLVYVDKLLSPFSGLPAHSPEPTASVLPNSHRYLSELEVIIAPRSAALFLSSLPFVVEQLAQMAIF